MRYHFLTAALRQANENRDLRRANRELTVALASANATCELAVKAAYQRHSEAEALYEIADPARRDGVMQVLEAIADLPEVAT